VRKFTISIISPVFLASVVVVLDQLTKWAAMRSVGPGAPQQERWIAGDWLGLAYGENSGVAFGLLRGNSTALLTCAVLLGLAAIGWLVWSYRANTFLLIAGGLIAGGAIGNLLDRIRFGHVRDFIAVGPWPSFNLADSAITIGAVIAMIGIWRSGFDPGADAESQNGATQTAMDIRP
jgi:signal peptidase II